MRQSKGKTQLRKRSLGSIEFRTGDRSIEPGTGQSNVFGPGTGQQSQRGDRSLIKRIDWRRNVLPFCAVIKTAATCPRCGFQMRFPNDFFELSPMTCPCGTEGGTEGRFVSHLPSDPSPNDFFVPKMIFFDLSPRIYCPPAFSVTRSGRF